MSHVNIQNALHQYSQTAVETSINTASPHRLVQMLMEGVQDKIRIARLQMERKELGEKAKSITCAISIVDGLRMSLDKEAGGDIAQNLDDIYDYMVRRLIDANLSNEPEILDEVMALMHQIKEAWDTIANVESTGVTT
ncbi:MAG: flagellar export chaperone FliS [Gammaproteobacteria bacterium]